MKVIPEAGHICERREIDRYLPRSCRSNFELLRQWARIIEKSDVWEELKRKCNRHVLLAEAFDELIEPQEMSRLSAPGLVYTTDLNMTSTMVDSAELGSCS